MHDIITIGSATQDIFISSPGFKIFKNKQFLTGIAECLPIGAKLEINKAILASGGGGTNSAVTFSRLGLKTASITKIGNDLYGQAIIQELIEEKINVKFVAVSDKKLTSFSVIINHPGFDRTILVYRGAANDISMEQFPKEKHPADWLYVTSLGGNIKLLRQIISWARGQKIKIAINPGQKEIQHGQKKLDFLWKNISVLIVNREEAIALTKTNNNLNVKNLTINLQKITGAITAVTDGRKGAWICDGSNNLYSPPTKDKPVNATGAGDAFGSGFVSGLILKNNLQYALKLGILNSGKVVTKIGAKRGLLEKLPTNL